MNKLILGTQPELKAGEIKLLGDVPNRTESIITANQGLNTPSAEDKMKRLRNLLKDGQFLEATNGILEDFFTYEQDDPSGETRYENSNGSYLDVVVTIKPEFISREVVIAVAEGILKNPNYYNYSSHYYTGSLLEENDFKQYIEDSDPVAELAYVSFVEDLGNGECNWNKFQIIPDSFFLDKTRRSNLEKGILQYVRTSNTHSGTFSKIRYLKDKALIPFSDEDLQMQLKSALEEKVSHYFDEDSFDKRRGGEDISSLVDTGILLHNAIIDVLDATNLEKISSTALIDLCVADLLPPSDPYVNRKRIYPLMNIAVDCVANDSTLMYLEEVLVPNITKLKSYGDEDHGYSIERRIKNGLMARFIRDLTNTNINVAYNEKLATRYNDLLNKVGFDLKEIQNSLTIMQQVLDGTYGSDHQAPQRVRKTGTIPPDESDSPVIAEIVGEGDYVEVDEGKA